MFCYGGKCAFTANVICRLATVAEHPTVAAVVEIFNALPRMEVFEVCVCIVCVCMHVCKCVYSMCVLGGWLCTDGVWSG